MKIRNLLFISVFLLNNIETDINMLISLEITKYNDESLCLNLANNSFIDDFRIYLNDELVYSRFRWYQNISTNVTIDLTNINKNNNIFDFFINNELYPGYLNIINKKNYITEFNSKIYFLPYISFEKGIKVKNLVENSLTWMNPNNSLEMDSNFFDIKNLFLFDLKNVFMTELSYINFYIHLKKGYYFSIDYNQEEIAYCLPIIVYTDDNTMSFGLNDFYYSLSGYDLSLFKEDGYIYNDKKLMICNMTDKVIVSLEFAIRGYKFYISTELISNKMYKANITDANDINPDEVIYI